MLASSRMTGLAQYSTPEYSKYHPTNKIRPTQEERQYRIILSADTASEVRQMLSQKRR